MQREGDLSEPRSRRVGARLRKEQPVPSLEHARRRPFCNAGLISHW